MKRIVTLAVLGLVACHHEKIEDKHLTEAEHTVTNNDSVLDTNVTETRAASEEESSTSTEDDAVEVEEPDGGVTLAVVTAKAPLHLVKGARVIGTVPIAKSNTDTKKEIGPSTVAKQTEDKSHTVSTDDKNKKLDTHLDDVHDAGPGFKFYLWLFGVVILLLVAGYFYLKLVKKVSWL